jgi:UDP-glucuronate decarboxylase
MAIGDGRVVSNFIVQALNGEPLTIYGDGNQTRSFCYVDDLVSGIQKVLNLKSNPKTPINLGNPNEFTMLELATKVLEITKSKSQLLHLDLPGDDPKQRRPDITKAEALLDWVPRVQLAEGIQRTADYFKGTLGS